MKNLIFSIFILFISSSALANLCELQAKYAAVSAVQGESASESGQENFEVYTYGYYTKMLSNDLLAYTGATPSAPETQTKNMVYNVHAQSTGSIDLIATVTVEAKINNKGIHSCKVKSIQMM